MEDTIITDNQISRIDFSGEFGSSFLDVGNIFRLFPFTISLNNLGKVFGLCALLWVYFVSFEVPQGSHVTIKRINVTLKPYPSPRPTSLIAFTLNSNSFPMIKF